MTPWEFFPVNAPTGELPTLMADEGSKLASATATGRREDVLPWELFPAPHYDDSPSATIPEPAINGHASPQANHIQTRQVSLQSI